MAGCGRAAPPRVALACPSAAPLQALMADQMATHPGLAVSDLLKLLQQASLGAEHAVTDSAAVRQWMQREWADLGPGPEVPLIEPLGDPGEYVRINLRPWRDRGGDPDSLTERFLATARVVGDTTRLICAVDQALDAARRGLLPLSADSLAAASKAWQAAGFPAMHHSTAYEARYRPAYRVIARRLLPELLETLPLADDSSPTR